MTRLDIQKGDVKYKEPLLHSTITNQLIQDIENGIFQLGGKLPSQSELVAKYKVSVATVRQALASLERRGIIRKEKGRGSFISLQSAKRENAHQLNSVGLLFETTGKPADYPAESHLLLALSDTCSEENLRLTIVRLALDVRSGGRDLIRVFEGNTLDGICVFLHHSEGAAERVAVLGREFRSAVAIFPSPLPEPNAFMPIDTITYDLASGMRSLMNYLFTSGHRRIAYVGPHLRACLERRCNYTGGRWEAYRQSLEEAGIGVDPDLVVEVTSGTDPGPDTVKAVLTLLDHRDPATVILGYNDWMARQILEWLWQEGIHVPGEVSVAGFDDVPFAREIIPPLTSVALPFQKVARTALHLMRDRLVNRERPVQYIVLPTEVVARKSVKVRV